MGVEYSAKIVVGLPYDELENKELLDDEVIRVFRPYYDADIDDCLVGLTYASTPDYGYEEFEYNPLKVVSLLEAFKAITGQDGEVFLTTIGS